MGSGVQGALGRWAMPGGCFRLKAVSRAWNLIDCSSKMRPFALARERDAVSGKH